MGEKLNRYGFAVTPDADKQQIKAAVESLYNVTVVSVNTIMRKGKLKSRYTKSGLIQGRAAKYKKALVTLKEGDTIDFIAIFNNSNGSKKIKAHNTGAETQNYWYF